MFTGITETIHDTCSLFARVRRPKPHCLEQYPMFFQVMSFYVCHLFMLSVATVR